MDERFRPWKLWFLYTVAETVYSGWDGFGLKYIRYPQSGFIRKFWTLKQAQAFADELNERTQLRMQQAKVRGIGRDKDCATALVLYFDRAPTDDDMRRIKEYLRGS